MPNKIIDAIRNSRAYFEDFVTRSTYHSNRIEGSTLSYAETYAIIFNDNSLQLHATARELYEAINHKYAIDYLLKNIDEPLSETMIKRLAQIINKNINEIDGYRHQQVLIRGVEHIPPAPAMIPQRMMYFVYNYNHSEALSPFDRAAQFHIEYECIHPFSDGNGRTGRLLVNYELIRNELPPVVVPFECRAEYMELLAQRNAPALSKFFEEQCECERQRMETILQAEPLAAPQNSIDTICSNATARAAEINAMRSEDVRSAPEQTPQHE